MSVCRTRQQQNWQYALALLRYPLWWCHSPDFECCKKNEQEWEKDIVKKMSFKADTRFLLHIRAECFAIPRIYSNTRIGYFNVLRYAKQSSKRSCRDFKSRTISCKTSFTQVFFVISFATENLAQQIKSSFVIVLTTTSIRFNVWTKWIFTAFYQFFYLRANILFLQPIRQRKNIIKKKL